MWHGLRRDRSTESVWRVQRQGNRPRLSTHPVVSGEERFVHAIPAVAEEITPREPHQPSELPETLRTILHNESGCLPSIHPPEAEPTRESRQGYLAPRKDEATASFPSHGQFGC